MTWRNMNHRTVTMTATDSEEQYTVFPIHSLIKEWKKYTEGVIIIFFKQREHVLFVYLFIESIEMSLSIHTLSSMSNQSLIATMEICGTVDLTHESF